MKKTAYFITLWLILAAFCLSPAMPAVLAQTSTNNPDTSGNGQALEIAPPVINVSGKPGETIKTTLKLRNISSGQLIVTNQINDFVAAGEDGTPKIITKKNDNNPYSLTDWLNPLPSLLIKSRQIKDLPVIIEIPENASPGGHYGVIRFTATPPKLDGTGVSLSASLGALMLVTVEGKAKESLSVEEFSVMQNGKAGTIFESTPLTFLERIRNTGNIHEQPVGRITITNMFNKKIADVNVNLNGNNILPQSIRRFEQPLDSSIIGNKKLFGRYKADLKLVYGKDGKVLNSSIVFWVIPYRLIGLIILLLIVGFFALRFLIRRYNRRIISKAQNQKPQNKND
ncbi:MAG TPA: hypothetical protein VFX86_03980 [Candidatus Saccharimonadales bacterium]|nr:hypothetical protein [Candidatus Saccharimonadales bacterium]